jgi:tetratricopeptide (TPR) repeat protein
MLNRLSQGRFRLKHISITSKFNLKTSQIKYGIFISILLIGICISCNFDKNKSRKHLTIAHEYFKKSDYTNALTEINNSISLDSTNYDAIILKAKIKSKLEFDEEAIKILLPLLKKSYKIDTLNFLLGESCFSLGNYYDMKKKDDELQKKYFEESIRYYTDALSNNPHYYDSYIAKSHALHNLKKYDEALITIKNALNIFPDSMILVYSRGVEKSFLGDKIEALKDLDKAIQSNKLDSSNMSTAFRFRGNINSDLNKIDTAIQDLSKAILYDPKNELAYYGRGQLYEYLAYRSKEDSYEYKGLRDKACEDYRKSAELGLITVYEKIKTFCNK